VLLAVLSGAWLLRGRSLIDPEYGIGYAFGIAAGIMLLAVLLYPLRKRFIWMGRLGRVSGWFRLHMTLGLLAPTLVLLHCNFGTGALNSNIALYALLTVAASGLVGRYLYSRIHMGLYGARARIPDLQSEARRVRQELGQGLPTAGEVWDALEDFERRALSLPRSMPARLWHAVTARRRSRRMRRRFIGECNRIIDLVGWRQAWPRRQMRRQRRLVAERIGVYFETIDRAATLAVFERLFAFWHILHVPLFVVLILAVIMHVIAVHLY
jgi:hypothetical protein